MPNRILRDWTDSFTIDELDVNAERFFTRLIMKVDDYGRFYADTRLLRSNLFPLKTDIRDTDISRWLAACEKAGLIAIYNVATKEFLQITNFKQVLRQKIEKYPPPNTCYADATHMHSNSIADVIPEKKRIQNPETKQKEKGENFLWTDVVKNFFNDYIWIEKFCRDKNIGQKDFERKQREFITDIELREDFKDLKELKNHFTNWFNKQKNGVSAKSKQHSQANAIANAIQIGESELAAYRTQNS